ncbi:hypothetical protein JAAARDRAFT_142836, partial [Jaapia argillacea MUCL 33604]
YQDFKDKSLTSNLKTHTISCFGVASIDTMIHRNTKASQVSATNNNQGCDWQQRWKSSVSSNKEAMTAGCPNLVLPSLQTISCDIHAAFNSMLEHPGQLNCAMDMWTSPNHGTFVVWTVQLEYERSLLLFALNIVEVSEISDVKYSHLITKLNNLSSSIWVMY